MNKRIAELKDLHVQSKPELKIFLNNADVAINKRSLPHLIRITHGVQEVIKGYDGVIDELFEEIERLYDSLAGAAHIANLTQADVNEFRRKETKVKNVLDWAKEQFDVEWTYEPGTGEVVEEIIQRLEAAVE